MACLGQAIFCILLNKPVIGFFFGPMAGVGIEAEIIIPVERLWVFLRPSGDFIFVDIDFAALHPGREFLERFRIVVLRNACVEPIVPIVNTAYEVVIVIDKTIRHESTTMEAPSVKD